MQLHLASLDLREVEDVVDDAQQVLARGVDVAQELGVLGVDLGLQAVQQDLGEADDRVERRAQLVAHVGQEAALEPVGLADAHVGLGQGAGALVEVVGQGGQLLELEALLGAQQLDLAALVPQHHDAAHEEEGRGVQEQHLQAGPPRRRPVAEDLARGEERAQVGQQAGQGRTQRGPGPAHEGRGRDGRGVPQEPGALGAAGQQHAPGHAHHVERHPGEVERPAEAPAQAAAVQLAQHESGADGEGQQGQAVGQGGLEHPGPLAEQGGRPAHQVDGDPAVLDPDVEACLAVGLRGSVGHRVSSRGAGCGARRRRARPDRRASPWTQITGRPAGRQPARRRPTRRGSRGRAGGTSCRGGCAPGPGCGRRW